MENNHDQNKNPTPPSPDQDPLSLDTPTAESPTVPEAPTPIEASTSSEPPTAPEPTPSATPEPTPELPTTPVTPKRAHHWIAPLRLLLWLIIIVGLSVGLALRARSSTSAAFANGTASAFAAWGNWIFWPSLALGISNFIWGITRWILRWRHEHWKPGRVIGKLIGGGIWRFFAVTPIILLTLLLLAPAIANAISARTIANHQPSLPSSTHLNAAYASGELSADTYLNYTLDLILDPANLPEQYRGSAETFRPDFLEFANEHFEELEKATIERVFEAADPLRNVEFDTDASGNLASATPSLFSTPASAASRDVTTLNKARLTPSERFVVFYTDIGHNAVSEETVSNLLAMLDNIVDNYKNNLGLDYRYYSLENINDIPIITTDIIQFFVNTSRKLSQQAVLAANGIDINITDRAMPVYVLDETAGESTTNVYASYAGLKFLLPLEQLLLKAGTLLIGNDTSIVYHTSPSYPFILLNPLKIADDDFTIVTAHELGHHYIERATLSSCITHNLGSCPNDDFLDETLPNYFAIHTADNLSPTDVIADHNRDYLRAGFCRPIDLSISGNDVAKGYCANVNGQFLGYPAVAFLQVYSELVPSAQSIMFDAIIQGNALQVLYNATDQATFAKAMQTLTERNLTKDFAQASLHTDLIPAGRDIPCNSTCSQTYTIPAAASEYFYFNTSEYDETTIKPIFNAPGLSVTILGHKDNIWTPIEQYFDFTTQEYTVQANSGYDIIAFAFANGSISDSAKYTISITAKPLENLSLSSDCILINFDDFINFGRKILNTFSPESLAEDSFFSDQNGLTDRGIHYATLCASELDPNRPFNEIESAIKAALKSPLKIISIHQQFASFSVYVDPNILNPLGSEFLVLANTNTTTQLLHVRFYETSPTND